jgi:hypothetical protein
MRRLPRASRGGIRFPAGEVEGPRRAGLAPSKSVGMANHALGPGCYRVEDGSEPCYGNGDHDQVGTSGAHEDARGLQRGGQTGVRHLDMSSPGPDTH